MEGRPLAGLQVELDPERPVDDLQPVAAAVERRPPVAVPDIEGPRPRAGPAQPAAVEPLAEQMAAGTGIGHRQVGHEEVPDRPSRRVLGRRVHADAEEGHLVAEPPAPGRLEVAGVVPPLDAVLRVAAVVPGKPPRVAGPGLAPALRGQGAAGRLTGRGPTTRHRRLDVQPPPRPASPRNLPWRTRGRTRHSERREDGSGSHPRSAASGRESDPGRLQRDPAFRRNRQILRHALPRAGAVREKTEENRRRRSGKRGPPCAAEPPPPVVGRTPAIRRARAVDGTRHRSAPAATCDATRAGYRPASAVAAAMRTVDCARNPRGRWNWMVQPKLCTLMT